MRFPLRLPIFSFLCVVGLLLAACGGGAAETTTTTTAAPDITTTTTAASATTTTQAEETSTTAGATGDATFEFEGEVQAGTQFEVTWSGPDNTSDYVTIVEPDAPEGSYPSYFYTSTGPAGTLTAPTTPGDYQLRYVDGVTGATLATAPIAIADREITLDPPQEVAAGTSFEVSWTALEAQGDYVSIVPVDSALGTLASYFYLTVGPTGTLIAPMTDGDFEIRFVSGFNQATMAASPITVTPLEITIEAPSEVSAGSSFQVDWTGPDSQNDILTITIVGGSDTASSDYGYTSEGSPMTLVAPDVPGDYEIRYLSGRVAGVFARVPITVS
jgi:Ca-activated chloride channel family protein